MSNYASDNPKTCMKCGTIYYDLHGCPNLVDQLAAAKRDLEEARGGIHAALNEIGIPDGGYPANIANAVVILARILARTEFRLDDPCTPTAIVAGCSVHDRQKP